MQGQPLNCPECEQKLQLKESITLTGGFDQDWETKINALRGGGFPLSGSERLFFETRMDRNFGDVRVHSGKQAADAANAINAKAFTLGKNIVFHSGAYQPGTQDGKQLLAHELTHVIQ